MQHASEKLRLSENHRRVVSVVLRGVEQMCDAVLGSLEKQSGLLFQVNDDLNPEQQQKLRMFIAKLQQELQRFNAEVELEPAVHSRKRTVRALLSASLVDLEESKSSRLKGYGPLSDAAKHKLDAELDRLVALLEEMANVVERV